MKRTLITALVALSFGAALPQMATADSHRHSQSYDKDRSAHQEQRQRYPKGHSHHKPNQVAKPHDRHRNYGRDFGFRVHHRWHSPRHHYRWNHWRHHRNWRPANAERHLSYSDVKYYLKDRDYRRIKKIAYEDGCYIVRARDPYGDKVRLTVDAFTGRIVDKRYR